jgi:nucleoid DNA-binding protein
MKKPEIAKRLARRSKSSVCEAADHLDGVVDDILRKVKRGEPALLPGVGSFSCGQDGGVTFEPERPARG